MLHYHDNEGQDQKRHIKFYLNLWLCPFNVKENWNPWVWISLCWQTPFYLDLSLRCNSHPRGVPTGKNGSQIWIEEIGITKRLAYSVILHLFIVLRIWKLSTRSVSFNFKFELMLLFTEYFKIVLERFRSSLLHYTYMDGILTVVRACTETQLDYSNYNGRCTSNQWSVVQQCNRVSS
jgi:hypothetical protein